MIEYMIAKSALPKLEGAVRNLVGRGWTPQGGVCTDPTSGDCLQAMTRTDSARIKNEVREQNK